MAYIFANTGAFLTSIAWCAYLLRKNKTSGEFIHLRSGESGGSLPVNYLLAFLTGTLWYGQFFFCNLGHVRLGKDYAFSSWAIHMIMLVLISSAVAHRQYEDAGRKIMLEVFADRVVISSPGLPPAPLTLPNLRRGKYRPCSRNPVLAQCLSYFHRIEERGSGFRRMRDQMLNHGLDQPLLGTDTGYFQVTFPGPNGKYDRIKTPEGAAGLVSPAVEAQLSARQSKMAALLASGESLTSKFCQQHFKVSGPAIYADFQTLIRLGIAKRVGAGRATRYVFSPQTESLTNH